MVVVVAGLLYDLWGGRRQCGRSLRKSRGLGGSRDEVGRSRDGLGGEGCLPVVLLKYKCFLEGFEVELRQEDERGYKGSIF
jgi:hypothetical protein